jgi:nicotinamide-nucleotide amidase
VGISEYFKGAVIAYDNDVKVKELGVPFEYIEKFGAVSCEVAEAMVIGVQKKLKTICAISTTGIAGPDGGSTEKPVGTVWIAVIFDNKLISRKFLFGDSRERNIIRASLSALNMLRNLLNEKR